MSSMFRMIFLIGLVYAPLCILSVSADAASGRGDMQVGVIDPTMMSEGEARRLCAQESYLVKCDIVFENKKRNKHKNKKHIFSKNYYKDKFFDEYGNITYQVFNANYE